MRILPIEEKRPKSQKHVWATLITHWAALGAFYVQSLCFTGSFELKGRIYFGRFFQISNFAFCLKTEFNFDHLQTEVVELESNPEPQPIAAFCRSLRSLLLEVSSALRLICFIS